jgi:hypothetical protein
LLFIVTVRGLAAASAKLTVTCNEPVDATSEMGNLLLTAKPPTGATTR